MLSMLIDFANDEQGQGLVEYALITSLIAVAAITALTFLGGKVANLFNGIGNNIASAVK